jgi:cobalamin biosynthesis protein CbiG
MSNASVVDASLKYDFDGSRHKTDAVKIQISTNNPGRSHKVELVGIRCKVGVKPGAYRLGNNRSTE